MYMYTYMAYMYIGLHSTLREASYLSHTPSYIHINVPHAPTYIYIYSCIHEYMHTYTYVYIYIVHVHWVAQHCERGKLHVTHAIIYLSINMPQYQHVYLYMYI